jgi:hypothetical protein
MTWQTEAKEHLLHAVPVEEDKGEPGSSSVAETRGTNPRFIDFDLAQVPTATWEHLPSEAWSTDRPAQLIELKSWNGFGLAVQIRPGLWLNLAYAKPEIGAQPPVHYYVFLGLTALVLSLVSVLVARRVARPFSGSPKRLNALVAARMQGQYPRKERTISGAPQRLSTACKCGSVVSSRIEPA